MSEEDLWLWERLLQVTVVELHGIDPCYSFTAKERKWDFEPGCSDSPREGAMLKQRVWVSCIMLTWQGDLPRLRLCKLMPYDRHD